MKRAAVIAVALTGLIALVLVLSGEGSGTVRIDAMFDTADGIVAGQNVDIAGTKVGTVSAVKLLRTGDGGFKAMMSLRIPKRFLPFHANASCRILPEGIISENYVDCDPGTGTGVLARRGSGTPTIAVQHTSAPLSLQAVLNTLAAPAPDRLRLVLNELGVATAGRGEDLNAILQRTNPALTRASDVLAIIGQQRQQLARAVTQTNMVLGELATRSTSVREFVAHAAAVLTTTAVHQRALGLAIARFPPLLTALDQAMAPIKAATTAGIPLLDNLRASAPGLTLLNDSVPEFTTAARPAVGAIGTAAATGVRTLGPLAPVASDLGVLATHAAPLAPTLSQLLVSIRDKGGIEGLMKLTYAFSEAFSAYDTTSHFVYALPQIYATCIIENLLPNTKDSPGCSHAYTQPDFGQIPASNIPSTTDGSSASSSAQLSDVLHYLLK
jgi:virulence factor Mce-like protein